MRKTGNFGNKDIFDMVRRSLCYDQHDGISTESVRSRSVLIPVLLVIL